MIKDGLFDQFPRGGGVWHAQLAGLGSGHFAASAGPVMASSNEFKITIRGKGGHAAMPHNALDPVPVACQMVQAFQTIISRNKKPIDAGVISVTMIHAGEATNVIPDSCELQGTVRTFSIDVLDMIEQRMK
jgi:amidohydrolase